MAHKLSYWSSSNDPDYPPTAAFLPRIDERTHGGVEAVSLLSDMPDAVRDAIGWHAVLWAEPYPSNRDQMQALYNEQQRHKQMVLSARFSALAQRSRVALSWTNPSGYEGFEKVRILRRTGGYPAGANDPAAVNVYEGKGSSVLDAGLASGVRYYYALYELPSRYTVRQAAAIPR